MATLPSGTILSVATGFAAAKPVSGISNATEAVVSCTGHDFAAGDYVQLYSGWGRLNRRIVKVKSPLAGTFVAEGIDTSNTEIYPASSGGGTVRKITAWTQISKYMNFQQSGGEPKNVIVRFMDEDVESTLNDGFTATSESFDVDADQFGTAAYLALRQLSDVQTDTCLKKTLKTGALIFNPCRIALNENVRMTDGQILSNTVSISGNGRITRYAA